VLQAFFIGVSMNTDSFYKIGSTHKVCQDYAIHGPNYVIISDGCSGAKNVDVGSRIIARTAEKILKNKVDTFENFYKRIAYQAESILVHTALNKDCLAATLLICMFDETLYNVSIVGDGIFFGRKRETQEIELYIVTFLTGAPYYLLYEMSNVAKDLFFEKYGPKFRIDRFIFDKDNKLISTDVCNGEITKDSFWFGHIFDREGYDLVGVGSDGFTTINNADINITCERLVEELFKFKNHTGEFVQRRCIRALKDFAAEGIVHTDDFSIGAIYVP
jgi:hypothetical protein